MLSRLPLGLKKLSTDRDTGISIPGMAFKNECIGKIELRNTPIAIIIDGRIIGISANTHVHLSFLFFDGVSVAVFYRSNHA